MTGTLFDHALRLHRLTPDDPLPRDGEPYPDHDDPRPRFPKADRRRVGVEVAERLDRHFADPRARPSDLAGEFRQLNVPIHENHHIIAAALRGDRDRVREAGRWLVRHSTDRNGATVGLALLATDWNSADTPLIQTIGLLSDHFSPLAAKALRGRGDEAALLWLARRVAGWGRVYLVEELCRYGPRLSRDWLLRHSCDGDFLNGYFAAKVAVAADLHTALVVDDPDDEMIDHAGLLLLRMAGARGMSGTLTGYPAAPVVVNAHSVYLGGQTPTFHRFVRAATLADELIRNPRDSGMTSDQRDNVVREYRSVLDPPEWCAAFRDSADDNDEDFIGWFTEYIGEHLGLAAFT